MKIDGNCWKLTSWHLVEALHQDQRLQPKSRWLHSQFSSPSFSVPVLILLTCAFADLPSWSLVQTIADHQRLGLRGGYNRCDGSIIQIGLGLLPYCPLLSFSEVGFLFFLLPPKPNQGSFLFSTYLHASSWSILSKSPFCQQLICMVYLLHV